MAIPPGGLEDAERAAELGWCTRKQAKEAIRITIVRASNGSGMNYYNALDTLRQKGWITQEGHDAVLEDRPRPRSWYEFWRKPPPPRKNSPMMIRPEKNTPSSPPFYPAQNHTETPTTPNSTDYDDDDDNDDHDDIDYGDDGYGGDGGDGGDGGGGDGGGD